MVGGKSLHCGKWSIPELKYHKYVPIFNVCVKFSLQISTRIFSESPFNVKYFAHSKVPSESSVFAAMSSQNVAIGKGRVTQKTPDLNRGDRLTISWNNRLSVKRPAQRTFVSRSPTFDNSGVMRCVL